MAVLDKNNAFCADCPYHDKCGQPENVFIMSCKHKPVKAVDKKSKAQRGGK